MGKGKMSMLDVRCMVKELRTKLIGLRLANIYHLNKNTYLLKLSASSVKQYLLLESGVRFHTTNYSRDHDPTPNNFAAKLRKHIRFLRLEDINQLGVDRVVDFKFASGDRCYHVLIELYAQGNIVLTNADYMIIMVLRVHTYGQKPLTENENLDKEKKQYKSDNLIDKGENEMNEKEIEMENDNYDNGRYSYNDDDIVEADNNVENSISSNKKDSDRVAVREYYPFKYAQQEEKIVTKKMIQSCIQNQQNKQNKQIEEQKQQNDQQKEGNIQDEIEEYDDGKQHNQLLSKDKQKIKVRSRRPFRFPPLKSFLASDFHFGPELIEHCLLLVGIEPNQSIDANLIDDQMIGSLVEAFEEATRMLSRLSDEKLEGYIVVREEGGKDIQIKKPKNKKRNKENKNNQTNNHDINDSSNNANDDMNSLPTRLIKVSLNDPITNVTAANNNSDTYSTNTISDTSISSSSLSSTIPSTSTTSSSTILVEKGDEIIQIYSEYLCSLFSQHSTHLTPEYSDNCHFVSFPSLDSAMDEYYSKQEEQKEKIRLLKEKAAALSKVERVKQSHQHQLNALDKAQLDNETKAKLIESHFVLVDECIAAINIELAKGVDWKELQRLLKAEKEKGNIVALVISQLKLEENTITLSLSPDLIHLRPQSSSTEKKSALRVDINLSLSAFNNAELYYSQKKKSAAKAIKTESASSAAIKAAEKKSALALKEVDVKAKISKLRRMFWFEKYHWFITSENYLVLGGKDAQQNESLVKKHLDKNDLYFHAEVHGASSVILKNPHSDIPVPPLSISQAAIMTICRSSAWKNKISVEAYWVYSHQVSKTAPTGMFLNTGSFMVRGKRNFVPRQPLVMGLGLLFKLDEESIHRHKGERKIKGLDELELKLEEEQEEKEEEIISPNSADNNEEEEEVEADTDVTSQLVFASNQHHNQSIMDELCELEDESEIKDEKQLHVNQKEKSWPDFPLPPTYVSPSLDRDTVLSSVEAEKLAESLALKEEEIRVAAAAKKRPTAAERRKLKKQQKYPSNQSSNQNNQDQEDSDIKTNHWREDQNVNDDNLLAGFASSISSTSSTLSASRSISSSKSNLSKTQRNKAKKIAKRYGLQDEEDLDIAASVLGLQNIEKKRKEIQQREFQINGKQLEQTDQFNNLSENQSKIINLLDTSLSNKKGERKKVVNSNKFVSPLDKEVNQGNNEVNDQEKTCFNCKQRGHVFKLCPYRKQSKNQQQLQPKAEQQTANKINQEEIDLPLNTHPSHAIIITAGDNGIDVDVDGEGNANSNSTVGFDGSSRSDIDVLNSLQTFSSARRAAQSSDAEELRSLLIEENLLDSVDPNLIDEIDSLTGKPLSEDILSFAIPVCAPYSALNDYKFKVKLLHGNQKKGKVIDQAMTIFRKTLIQNQYQNLSYNNPNPPHHQESELLKSLIDNDFMGVLLSGVKLSAPGLNDGSKRRKKRVQ